VYEFKKYSKQNVYIIKFKMNSLRIVAKTQLLRIPKYSEPVSKLVVPPLSKSVQDIFNNNMEELCCGNGCKNCVLNFITRHNDSTSKINPEK